KSIRDRLEVLLLLMNAVARSPPPCLVDEWAVSRVHQTDDSVIDADWHFGLEICQLVFRTELFNGWSRLASLGRLGETCARGRRIGDVDPDEIVLLLAGITTGIDAIDLHRLIGSEGRNQLALAVVYIKLPSVIRALEVLAIERTRIKR